MTVYIGSARKDSRGKFSGDAKGDQLQKSTPDYTGEVSQQPFYKHSKGWYVLRLENKSERSLLAKKMRTACDNNNIGYDQGSRYSILKNGVNSSTKTACDCSSLVRQCVKEATGVDVGDFNTENERSVLLKSGLFYEVGVYTDSMNLCTGDVLVTKTKGHTVIVTKSEAKEGNDMKDLPLVQYGSKGSAVKALQKMLRNKGYELAVDGDFGKNTLTKTKNFQKSEGLAQDGRCGKKTWAKIFGF